MASVAFTNGITIQNSSILTVTMKGNDNHVGFFGYDRTSQAAKEGQVAGFSWALDENDNPIYGKINTGTASTSLGPVFNLGYNDVAIRLEVIPEPATATLSLLALAGLAARRRRK